MKLYRTKSAFKYWKQVDNVLWYIGQSHMKKFAFE